MRLLQLNTQFSGHDDKLEDFLSREQFDILTLQEVSTKTLERFSGVFHWHFERNFVYQGVEYGVAILARKWIPINNVAFNQYWGGTGDTKQINLEKPNCDYYNNGRFWILAGDVGSWDHQFVIGTSYFPVAYPSDQTNPDQIACMDNLVPAVEYEPNMIFTGDLNIARSSSENWKSRPQHPLYPRLASILTDNIPPQIDSTLDPRLFRVPWLKVVCDYIWSRWNHRVSNVRLHIGLSDHQGISADISK